MGCVQLTPKIAHTHTSSLDVTWLLHRGSVVTYVVVSYNVICMGRRKGRARPGGELLQPNAALFAQL